MNPPQSEIALRPTVLIVDGDAVGRRYLELALGATKRYRPEVAEDCAGALEILSHTVVNLVIADLALPDQDGFHLLRKIRGEGRWRSLPVFLTGSDPRSATRVSAFQLGADDFLAKPISVAETVARVDAVIARVSKAKSKWRGRRYELAGNFRGLCFSDLLNILENGQRTGVLTIMTRRAGGAIFFESGRIRHASFGTVAGHDAVYRFFAEKEGEFEFFPSEVGEEIPNTIGASPTGLMLEAARRMDHAEPNETRIQPRPDIDVGLAPEQAGAGLRLEPDARLAGKLIEALEDPFTLGEMRLVAQDDLKEWMDIGASARAIQIIFVVATDPGVMAFGSLAAPLSESQIAKALLEGSPALGLEFDARDTNGLQLLLVDPENPGRGLGEYGHVPSIVVLAPPGGDWMGFSIAARVALMEFLRDHAPTVVLGLGNETVADGLTETAENSGCRAVCQVTEMPIDDQGTDVREVLAAALRLWASAATQESVQAG